MSARSRAVSAIDRFLGSLVDIPGAWTEGVSRRIRLKNKQTERLHGIDDKEALRVLARNGQLGIRAAKLFISEHERKYFNREAVAYEAIEEMLSHQPDAIGEIPSQSQERSIDEDWLNTFGAYAERASSGDIRKLWGRILSGEIRRPGAFSLRTLRGLSEIDQYLAQTFQRVVENRIDTFIIKQGNFEGQELLDLTLLEEHGLLQEVGGNVTLNLPKDPDGSIILASNKCALKIKPLEHYLIPVILISKFGNEVCSLLPKEPDEKALRHAASCIQKHAVNIELCSLVSQDGLTSTWQPTETIYRIDATP